MRISKLSLLALILFTSCTSDLEKYEKEVASCMKDTKKELKTEYRNMDEAIAGLDFSIAHSFFSCYKPGWYNSNTHSYMGTEKQYLNDFNPKDDAANRLANAEVTYLMSLNEFDRALAVHEELIGNRKDNDNYGIIGADERFNIYKKACLYFLEKEDAQSATKWAKRAPNDLTSKGIFTEDLKESQQADLLTLIAGY